jgi:hypothetical protein
VVCVGDRSVNNGHGGRSVDCGFLTRISQPCTLAQVQTIQIKGHLHEAAPKMLQEQVNSFLINFDFNISKDVILPESSTLTLLRCTHEEVEDTDHREQD